MPFAAALPAIFSGASALGSLFGGGAKASADARRQEALLQAQLAGQNLEGSKFNLQAPSQRANQVVRGDVLSSAQPGGQNLDPRAKRLGLSGGLTPAMFGQASRQAGGQMSREALLAMLTGSDRIKPVQMAKAGKLEKLGGILGTVGGLAGIAGGFLPQSAPRDMGAIGGVPSLPGSSARGYEQLPPILSRRPLPFDSTYGYGG